MTGELPIDRRHQPYVQVNGGRRDDAHPSRAHSARSEGCPYRGRGMSSRGTRSRVPTCLAASISQ
ncbi:hypothetical protein FGF04_06670 [Streptomyces apricus]|uniref:Uncharacterized protein n=1 Tax=Streptomyces apricus TaxID=1828112 RepID=A0A5B0BI84_9ACTN|nr:hypothetical protein FGF04_06670 [Streptomyces apricus]